MACRLRTFGKLYNMIELPWSFGPLEKDENWLKSLKCSICPSGKTIAVGKGDRIARGILSNDRNSYYVPYEDRHYEESNMSVTSILCLPMCGYSELDLIIIGLSSGTVSFRVDEKPIYMQRFHEGPVLHIKAYSPPYATSYGPDFCLYFVYEECVCMLKGTAVFRILSEKCTWKVGVREDILPFRKFILPSHRESTKVNDAALQCGQKANTYDEIIKLCLASGINLVTSGNLKQSLKVVEVGADPYTGLYYVEECREEIPNDKNWFSKLCDLWKTQPETDDGSSPTRQELLVRTRCQFYDGKREGFCIVESPNGRLAAVTDNLDRVMLVDLQRCLVLDIFRGYPEAQCGFMCVEEASSNTACLQDRRRRKALFLVIYAPSLGRLEIFALGSRKIAALDVSKNGKLVYNTHALLNSAEEHHACFFFDPIDGSVNVIEIPFHFACSELNAQISRDMRRLRKLLRDVSASSPAEDIASLAEEFETVEVKQDCVETLKKNRHITLEIFGIIVKAFTDNIGDSIEFYKTPLDEKTTQLVCMKNLAQLTDFYESMQSSPQVDLEERVELLESDLELIDLLILHSKGHETKTSPPDNISPVGNISIGEKWKSFRDFVKCLDIFELSHADCIPLQRAQSNKFADVSSKLFGRFFQCGFNFEYFKSKAAEAGIPCGDLLELVLHYWLEKPFVYDSSDAVISEMSQLAAIVSLISEIAVEQKGATNLTCNAFSPWWKNVLQRLLNFPKKTPLVLLASIVCRDVAINLWKEQKYGPRDEATRIEDTQIERWMPISREDELWRQHIGKSKSTIILGAVLSNPNLSSTEPIMPIVQVTPKEPVFPFMVYTSIDKAIHTRGEGIVSELVASWLIFSRIHPKFVVEDELNGLTESDGMNEVPTSQKTVNSEKVETDVVLKKLATLRQHFPFSCQSGMLLTQMSQQYMVYWSQHPRSLEYLRAVIICLEQFKNSDFALKHGLCSVMWKSTLKKRLLPSIRHTSELGHSLTDDCGAIPATSEYLELALEFFKHYAMSMQYQKRTLYFEKFIPYGRSSLQDIALCQFPAKKERLQLMQQVLTVLHFIVVFRLEVFEPINVLFNSAISELENSMDELYIEDEPDLKMQQLRREFLCKVISASVDLIRDDVVEHVEFMEKICQLAGSWKLDLVPLRQHQVIQLYAHGFDVEAEKILKQLSDLEALGAPLIVIAGRRLSLFASGSEERYLNIASVGQKIMEFLDELVDTEAESATETEPTDDTTDPSESPTGSAKNAALMQKVQITATEPREIEIEPLRKLVINAMECLSTSGAAASPRLSKYLHVGGQLYDACSTLE